MDYALAPATLPTVQRSNRLPKGNHVTSKHSGRARSSDDGDHGLWRRSAGGCHAAVEIARVGLSRRDWPCRVAARRRGGVDARPRLFGDGPRRAALFGQQSRAGEPLSVPVSQHAVEVPADSVARSEQGPLGPHDRGRHREPQRHRLQSNAQICGSDFGRKAQEEVHKRLVGYVRSIPGQVGDDMCWCYLYASSPNLDSPYANPWTTAKLLQSEVDLFRLTGEDSHKKLARRLFEGLRKAAVWDTDRAFYANGGQGFKAGKNALRLSRPLLARRGSGDLLLAKLP